MRVPDRPDCRIALVLGGGSALGSYHAGLYQAMAEAGCEPDWVIGSSIGAVSGALIAGNAPDRRLAALEAFWRPAAAMAPVPAWAEAAETLRRSLAVQWAVLAGRADMFDAVGPLGSWWRRDPGAGAPGLFDQDRLEGALDRLVDWPRLNRGAPRFSALAVDMDDGGDVLFDTRDRAVTARHVRASGAFPPLFPPVEVEGRLLADGGLSANLPLDPVLADAGAGPTLCIAADLLPLAGGRPRSLGEVAGRAQDLLFAIQSRRTIAFWRQIFQAAPDRVAGGMTLVHLAYADQAREVAGKALDFSPETAAARWRAGHADGQGVMAGLASGAITVTPGAFAVV